MAESTDVSGNVANIFPIGKRMKAAATFTSNFVRSSDGAGGSLRKKSKFGCSGLTVLPSSASIFSDLTGLPMNPGSSSALGTEGTSVKTAKNLSESNIGFRLLKKSGWKEGSGLGVSEQGRLDPLETSYKSDRRGIGAEKVTNKRIGRPDQEEPDVEDTQDSKKRQRNLSKKARKAQAEAERMQEQAFTQEFYREFWPENL